MLLSVDAGFKKLGWAVFDKGVPVAWGIIKTEKSTKKTTRMADDNAYRCGQIARKLLQIIGNYKCTGIVGELPSGGSKSSSAARSMGLATGIAGTLVGILDLPAEWCTPGEVKIAVTGKVKASKDEVMDGIRGRFSQCDFPKTKTGFEDIADACGAYLALRNGNLVKLFG